MNVPMSKAQREVIAAELERIYVRDQGLLTPDAVVAEAKNKSNALHNFFEWTDRDAAHQYRLDQARQLIRSVRVNVTTKTTVIESVAYVHHPDLVSEQGYVSVRSITERDFQRSVLLREFQMAASALRRAETLAIAFGMQGEIQSLVETTTLLIGKVSEVEARV